MEALALLAFCRCLLGVLPFRTAMQWLGLRLDRDLAPEETAADVLPVGPIQAVSRAVARAARVAPFRAVCLQQSVAAALMLRRRGQVAEVHFGLAKDESGRLKAHAWSRCQGVIVTGGRERPGYTAVSTFVS